jgi:hypothetical protein
MNTNTKFESIATSYSLSALASVPQNMAVASGMRECRIIIKDAALKASGKVSQYCQLPEVSEGFVQSFICNATGLEAVKDFIAGLQDAMVRKVYVGSNRSPCDADLSIDMLAELARAEAENTRVTKESVTVWFESKKAEIANFLARTRMPEATLGTEFWQSESGQRMIGIASNYKIPFLELAAKRPAFTKPEIKEKVEMVCAAVMTGTVFEEKMLARLQGAVIATPDELGL